MSEDFVDDFCCPVCGCTLVVEARGECCPNRDCGWFDPGFDAPPEAAS